MILKLSKKLGQNSRGEEMNYFLQGVLNMINKTTTNMFKEYGNPNESGRIGKLRVYSYTNGNWKILFYTQGHHISFIRIRFVFNNNYSLKKTLVQIRYFLKRELYKLKYRMKNKIILINSIDRVALDILRFQRSKSLEININKL